MANNETPIVPVEKTPGKKKYQVVGLQDAETMPIEFQGLRYDLAKLSDADLDVLVKGKCPYVAKN